MTRSANGPRVPGTILLKIARVLVSEHLHSAVVQPTIADFQCEVAEAGLHRDKRRRAQWRGYCAFWTLILVVPFASGIAPAGHADAFWPREAVVRLTVGSTLLILLAIFGPLLGVWVAVLAAVPAVFALVIHAWYTRHPSNIPAPTERRWRSPEINFSSTEVAGNIGGLIFVVGSVVILAVGLPWVFWFLLPGTIVGCALAGGLVAWHTRHPKWGLPENRIEWR